MPYQPLSECIMEVMGEGLSVAMNQNTCRTTTTWEVVSSMFPSHK